MQGPISTRRPFGIPLPSPLGDIVEVAGLDAAMKLSMALGGARYSFPRLTHKTLLTSIVGPEAAQKIVAKIGGLRFYIPLAKRHLIYWLDDQGLSQERIARTLKCSRTVVHEVLNPPALRRVSPHSEKEIHAGIADAQSRQRLAKYSHAPSSAARAEATDSRQPRLPPFRSTKCARDGRSPHGPAGDGKHLPSSKVQGRSMTRDVGRPTFRIGELVADGRTPQGPARVVSPRVGVRGNGAADEGLHRPPQPSRTPKSKTDGAK